MTRAARGLASTRLFVIAPAGLSLAIFNAAKQASGVKALSFSEFALEAESAPKNGADSGNGICEASDGARRQIIVSAYDAARLTSIVEAADRNADILIAYPSPETAIAGTLLGGTDVEIAIDRWRGEAEQLLAVADHNPQRCTLVCDTPAKNAVMDLRAFIAGRYGLNLALSAGRDNPAPPPLAQALARLLIHERPQARAARDRLAARSFPLGDEQPSDDISAAVSDYLHLISIDAERDEAVKAAEILRSHLHSSQYRLEARFKRAEKTLMDATDKKLASIEAERNALAGELAVMKSSVAWRLTAPLRLVARIVNDKALGYFRSRRLAKVVSQSPLFDADWYRREYKDIAAQKIDPALHYVRFGGVEGRAPGPNFNGAAYLAANPDLAGRGVNPLVHYILHGQKEGRPIRPRASAARSAGA